MKSTASRLPTFETLPLHVALSAGCGYIYGKIADSTPSLWAKIYAICSLASNILFLGISTQIDSSRTKCIVWSCTTAVTHIIEIIALRHFNLIGTTGTAMLGIYRCWALAIHLQNS